TAVLSRRPQRHLNSGSRLHALRRVERAKGVTLSAADRVERPDALPNLVVAANLKQPAFPANQKSPAAFGVSILARIPSAFQAVTHPVNEVRHHVGVQILVVGIVLRWLERI